MATITARPIWVPVLYESNDEAVTILGGQATFAKGAECRFYLSIFETFGGKTAADPGTLFDISNFVSFILKIWASGYGSGTLLLDTSDAASIAAGVTVSYNYDATAANFWNRAKSQIQIYIPAAITANVTAQTNYGVLTGATAENAAQPDWFGNLRVVSKEVGLGTAATPPTPAELYVRSDVFQAAMSGVVKFGRNANGRYPILVNADGSYGTALRTGDSGEWLEEQIPNP